MAVRHISYCTSARKSAFARNQILRGNGPWEQKIVYMDRRAMCILAILRQRLDISTGGRAILVLCLCF